MTEGESKNVGLNKATLLKMIDEVQDYAIILLDVEGNIQNWNAGAERIKGYKEEEILGKNFEVFYTPADRTLKKPKELLKRASELGKAMDEGWRLRKDGTKFWGSITINAVHDDSGAVIGFGKVTRDLTDFVKAQHVRELEVRNKELSQFNYIASHDLQEPLRTVLNYIQIIEEDFGESLNAEVLNYLTVIHHSAERMSKLITALLEYSQLGKKPVLGSVDCNSVVEIVLADLQNLIVTCGAVIEVGSLPSINAYAVELRQLFQNLIANAVKFRKDNVAPHIKVSADLQPEGWCFSVTDNGIGIEEKNHERIFNIFQRIAGGDKYEGQGIGLANCKKIAELHGGRIWLHSKPGEGSTFYFTLSNKLL
jgi:PAS domain S-box-containing protein